jgi:Lar family restriction alleviation protein
MEELKPCPFCGAIGIVQTSAGSHNTYSGKAYFVQCAGTRCKVNPQTYTYAKKATAIKAWNRRRHDG